MGNIVVTNLAIANALLFFTIMSMAVTAHLGLPVPFLMSVIGTVFAGAVRHDELAKQRRSH